MHVPIEIKKNRNKQLWTSIERQLVSRYAIDPAADGHGIYLVLWFGKRCTKRHPEGDRPGSAQELEDRLNQTLSHERRRKISVCVMDVSGAPPG